MTGTVMNQEFKLKPTISILGNSSNKKSPTLSNFGESERGEI